MFKFLCYFGFHRYKPIESTLVWVDRYTEGADLVCERCGNEAYGERPIW